MSLIKPTKYILEIILYKMKQKRKENRLNKMYSNKPKTGPMHIITIPLPNNCIADADASRSIGI